MPHVTVQWTDNLEGDLEVRALLELIAEDVRTNGEGAFPIGGLRIRAIRLGDYVIADGRDPRAAFINIEVQIAHGRPADFQARYFGALFERVKAFLGDLFERRPLALSLYVQELDGWKHNTIHKTLKSS